MRWVLAGTARRILLDSGLKTGMTACGTPIRGEGGRRPHWLPFHALGKDGQPVDLGTARLSASSVSIGNLAFCGSARCPRCAPFVAARLSERVSDILTATREKAGRLAF